MNSIEQSCLSTIHVTPEDGFSYASFEAMGYDSSSADLGKLVNSVLSCFKPSVFSIALHASGQPEGVNGSWEAPILPIGYLCDGSTKETLPTGTVVFHTFRAFGNAEYVQVDPLPVVESWMGVDAVDDVGCMHKIMDTLQDVSGWSSSDDEGDVTASIEEMKELVIKLSRWSNSDAVSCYGEAVIDDGDMESVEGKPDFKIS
jgi:hypothetical protein